MAHDLGGRSLIERGENVLPSCASLLLAKPLAVGNKQFQNVPLATFIQTVVNLGYHIERIRVLSHA